MSSFLLLNNIIEEDSFDSACFPSEYLSETSLSFRFNLKKNIMAYCTKYRGTLKFDYNYFF